MDPVVVQDFRTVVYEYYAKQGRHDLPWRQPEADGSFNAYKILISELMLQQTQVSRVLSKYSQFLEWFPDVMTLAKVPLSDVLQVWQGLGYNRRAKFLLQAARMIRDDFTGSFPPDQLLLTKLPGVGLNTAGAIMAYAFNQPVVFIETNIRTVYIYHFFANKTAVADREVTEFVKETLDQEQPREWYWALMDYGSHLKQTAGNTNRFSDSYSKQSRFIGSRRQIRGQVIRFLANGPLDRFALTQEIPDQRLADVLVELEQEGLITHQKDQFSL